MEEYLRSNQRLWDDRTAIHEKSAFYDVEGFKAGRSSLHRIEVEELGDVSGKSLLHLQCHFGMDTLSWARLGAKVTGVDFSERAIGLARSLSEELGIPARFIRSNVYELAEVLSGEEFDIVFTSYGVLGWLPDLERWAEVVFRFLKPGGTFYVVEGHPFANVFDEEEKDLIVKYPYFHGSEPLRIERRGSYADAEADYYSVEYAWDHSLSEIVNSLIAAGLRIERLNEFPYQVEPVFQFMEQDEEGRWCLKDRHGDIPLMFSLRALKEAK